MLAGTVDNDVLHVWYGYRMLLVFKDVKIGVGESEGGDSKKNKPYHIIHITTVSMDHNPDTIIGTYENKVNTLDASIAKNVKEINEQEKPTIEDIEKINLIIKKKHDQYKKSLTKEGVTFKNEFLAKIVTLPYCISNGKYCLIQKSS